MQGDGHHPVGVVERVLYAVAVVAVDVDVRDSHPFRHHSLYGHYGVVEHAKTVGVAGHGVVQAAGDAGSRLHVALH